MRGRDERGRARARSRTARRCSRCRGAGSAAIASITSSGHCVPPGPSKNASRRSSAVNRARTAATSSSVALTVSCSWQVAEPRQRTPSGMCPADGGDRRRRDPRLRVPASRTGSALDPALRTATRDCGCQPRPSGRTSLPGHATRHLYVGRGVSDAPTKQSRSAFARSSATTASSGFGSNATSASNAISTNANRPSSSRRVTVPRDGRGRRQRDVLARTQW